MLAHQPQQKKDRHDTRWFFTHKDRCHLCGFLIHSGERFQTAEVVETYTLKGGVDKRLFRAQWHVDCCLEMSEQ